MANPYSILGVSKSADEKTIKSAFRKLAKKYHPDQNKDDSSAQAKFAEVNQAYEILGDKEKRAQFDRGEIDDTGKPKFAGFEGGNPFDGFQSARGHRGGPDPFSGGFGDAEDILSEVFGSAFSGRNARGGFTSAQFGGGPQATGRTRTAGPSLDVKLKAAVSVEDLLRGKTPITLPDGKRISISIPPEAKDGQTIRLAGQGNSAPRRKPGDLLVTLVFRKNDAVRIDGVDLRKDLPVPIRTAVLGGKLAVETMDGKLSLTIPPGTPSGKVFRLKNRGLPKKSGGHGDLLLSAKIEIEPEEMAQLQGFFQSE